MSYYCRSNQSYVYKGMRCYISVLLPINSKYKIIGFPYALIMRYT